MAGVCPKCVRFYPEGQFCEHCGTTLMPPRDWKAARSALLAPKPEDIAPAPHKKSIEEGKDFSLGFFLGALLFFFAFLSSYLLLGDKLPF